METNEEILPRWKKIYLSILWFVFYCFEVIFILFLVVVFYYESSTRLTPPEIKDHSAENFELTIKDQKHRKLPNAWLRNPRKNIYEVYVSGSAYERGISYGRLLKKQVRHQESIFVNQFKNYVPSHIMQFLLGKVIRWFNRDLPEYIKPEYKKEIFGISRSFSKNHKWIGTPYERILNYHAAHDIGHALNDYQVVGCTSFAVNDQKSQDSNLLIGRNFDFFVGEEFAQEKVVLIENPDRGLGFVSYSWAGFVGVASGMNEKGLTVTINAAKSKLPTVSKTPISLLAREILQYASNIDEAVAVAEKRDVFVSESILIGSAADQRSVIIEKSPSGMDVYDPKSPKLVCSNHYQSDHFKDSPSNIKNKKESDSQYRYARMQELLGQYRQLDPENAAEILRNQKGKNGKDIGMANPKAINQLIAHHSVIFKPHERKMWISMPPYQLGEYICYDLKKIFSSNTEPTFQTKITVDSLNIPADPFLKSQKWKQFQTFNKIKTHINDFVQLGTPYQLTEIKKQKLIESNPNSYLPHKLLGDYYHASEETDKAIEQYNKALKYELPSKKDRAALNQKIKTIEHE